MTRHDLLALTPDTLASLANRGLVKRAAKDLDAGKGPAVSVGADGSVLGRFTDGTEAVLAPGAGLEPANCTCDAPGVCRHLIATVLGYQRTAPTTSASAPTPAPPPSPAAEPGAAHEADKAARSTGASGAPGAAEATGGAGPDEPAGHPDDGPGVTATQPSAFWCPGSLTDEELEKAVGARALAAARRTFERGYVAVLHSHSHRRSHSHNPDPGHHPWVELPTCTVRFPVPGEVGYALTDAADAVRAEMVTLAVWAFRAALDRPATEPDAHGAGGPLRVQVGGRPAVPVSASALRSALALADELLLDGAAHTGPVMAGALGHAGAELTAGSMHWPAGAIAELGDQLGAYGSRSAHYRPERFAALIAELHARRRAAAVSPEVLGTREADETPLRRVRLTALGCRIEDSPKGPTAQVYFAHAEAGAVLVLRKHWQQREPARGAAPPAAAQGGGSLGAGRPLTGHDLSARRILGTSLGALAASSIVSESARRTASRALSVSRGRLGTTSVTPVGAAWSHLPESVLVHDLAAHTAAWDGRPPQLIRPRVEAEHIRVVAISAVESIGYDAAQQQLEAFVRDSAGTPAVVRAAHRPLSPGALDTLAEALGKGPRFISGAVRRAAGQVVIDPVAVGTAGGVVVPDLAPGDAVTALGGRAALRPEPLAAALDDALAALGEVAHQGLRHLRPPTLRRLRDAEDGLRRIGLGSAAALLHDLRAAPQGSAEAAEAWVDAQIRLLVTAEAAAGCPAR